MWFIALCLIGSCLSSVETVLPATLSPFMFVCNYHANQGQRDSVSREITLNVNIDGNPEFYVPGTLYRVTVTSTINFDGFLLTGMYTTPSLPRAGPDQSVVSPRGQNFLCQIVHTHMGHRPQQALSFVWMAPQKGTGCVSFLATATLGQQILFKDTTVLKLCEREDLLTSLEYPDVSDLHDNGVIFRDNFDSSVLDAELWSPTSDVEVSSRCGSILHGNAAVLCGQGSNNTLMTVPLNVSSASVLQFTVGSGSCTVPDGLADVVVSYGSEGCNNWTVMDTVSIPSSSDTAIHIVSLPPPESSPVCLQFHYRTSNNISNTTSAAAGNTNTSTTAGNTTFSGCWALDNVVVTSTLDLPTVLIDDFDPVQMDNWLFFPGAKIKYKCYSDNNALCFYDNHFGQHFVSTRDLNLNVSFGGPNLFSEDFEGNIDRWRVSGGTLAATCWSGSKSLSMNSGDTTRHACTPSFDGQSAGSIRFMFMFGGSCNITSRKVKVTVYAVDANGNTHVLEKIRVRKQQPPSLMSIPLPSNVQRPGIKICWLQKRHSAENVDVWSLDDIQVVPHIPAGVQHVAQFSLNLQCGTNRSWNSVELDFSTNHGRSWHRLHSYCLPGSCSGSPQLLTSLFKPSNINGWTRLTLPLPWAALVPTVRFRWRQDNVVSKPSWALDNVYIGACLSACSGHGYCTSTGCRCDLGYHGADCSSPALPHPLYLMENVASLDTISRDRFKIDGAVHSYDCGVVSTGKALVFNQRNLRQVDTRDLNTTLSRYLQFSVRIGSNSVTSTCPPPSHTSGHILLMYSSDGGVTWWLLKDLTVSDHLQPGSTAIHLPEAAMTASTRFRWWQPVHSGYQRDVWALDDIMLTDKMFNTLTIDMSHHSTVPHSLDIHLGSLIGYCSRSKVLGFTKGYQEAEQRYVVTEALHVGPSYMIQFELVMGCEEVFSEHVNNQVYLEYSTNHGMTWSLVQDGCVPPGPCDSYMERSVYDATEFNEWKRVTLPLLPSTWSKSTKFRLRQSWWSLTDNWAVTFLYVGQQCPDFCQGHGRCYDGVCRCDELYSGDTCSSRQRLQNSGKADFSLMTRQHDHWLDIYGGQVVSGDQGCGTILSGESLYFSKFGVRKLVTVDLDTRYSDYVQFYARVGGGSTESCQGANERAENVLVQYSNDGGTTWHLLKELYSDELRKPMFVHIDLPSLAKTSQTRLRWWQPAHSGPDTDQWAVDEISIGQHQPGATQHVMEDSSQTYSDQVSDQWSETTDAMMGTFCQSSKQVLMFTAQDNQKFVTTKDLQLSKGDIVQFKINVGCTRAFSYDYPVYVEYSHDSGNTWHLVQLDCYLEGECGTDHHEGSVYYSGTYGEWTRVIIPLNDEITLKKTRFHWIQNGGFSSTFALDSIYIGTPCGELCNGHGTCHADTCSCDRGYLGPYCESSQLNDKQPLLFDRFDDDNKPSALWSRVLGGHLGRECGIIDVGNGLYFGELGSRVAETVELNATNIKVIQFVIKIGSFRGSPSCLKPQHRNEGVILDYSINNGITWHTLKVMDPFLCCFNAQVINVRVPPAAKTLATKFRWWQPLGEKGVQRAQWSIDSIVVGVNDTSMFGFQEDFSPLQEEVWFMAQNALPRISCGGRGSVLEFSKSGGSSRYAETWDFHVTSSMFLQFDLNMGCSGPYSSLYNISLEYSIDLGRTWQPVTDECTPSVSDCTDFNMGTRYLSGVYPKWTRVTVYLPSSTVSPNTRFRWIQHSPSLRTNVWALDNVYLGDGCPWMCSGHGYCQAGQCVCDKGFGGVHCVSVTALSKYMKDTFQSSAIDRTKWTAVYGGEITAVCGVVVEGTALVFFKAGLRQTTSKDLDLSTATQVQFWFKYGCLSGSGWPRNHSVLLQYSNNGGITWHLVKELHYEPGYNTRVFSLDIPIGAMTNCTRLRFWQPNHAGHMTSVWSIDNFFIGGDSMHITDSVYETFDSEPRPTHWLFWPGGRVDSFCAQNIRYDSTFSGTSAMVFEGSAGEHSITTTDIDVGPASVIQFEINVGCSSVSSRQHPIKLEYSKDHGKTWRLVIEPCGAISGHRCTKEMRDATVYYSGRTSSWYRVIVPLVGLKICGLARFRWYQGFFNNSGPSIQWALDNVYIGRQCSNDCHGHGACVNGLVCQCDDKYDGLDCYSSHRNINYLKDDFDGKLLSSSKWPLVSGGQLSHECGNVMTQRAVYFSSQGHRMLESRDLDLSTVSLLQFYLKLGCPTRRSLPYIPDPNTAPVYLQYSINGGISWHTIDTFKFGPGSDFSSYVAIPWPEDARYNSTRIRFWHPTEDGAYLENWAVDQLYLGGNIYGQLVLQDDFAVNSDTNWLLTPGGHLERVCGVEALHFSGDSHVRYAVTSDVNVNEFTYLQFALSMGCVPSAACFSIDLEYSVDLGKTWSLVINECLPTDVDCPDYHSNSTYISQLYSGWNRVIIPLPYYTRSSATRFRWIQRQSNDFQDVWSLANVYIGHECDAMCSGHGRCLRGQCKCDDGWYGEYCHIVKSALSQWLIESFEGPLEPRYWRKVVGGTLTDQSAAISSGKALHMSKTCSRLLETVDLDLRRAVYIQFDFRYGLQSLPNNRDEDVLIDYSADGGITWTTMTDLYYDLYNGTRFVHIKIPSEARYEGVRIRWWQPRSPRSSDSDWLIDNLVIGGWQDSLRHISTRTAERSRDQPIWLPLNNVVTGRYCGASGVMKALPTMHQNVTMTTIDVDVQDGDMLQFNISIGCDVPWDSIVNPVYLEFSSDYGRSWKSVIEECLPSSPQCSPQGVMATILYSSKGWRVVTVKLKGPVVSKATRFRWLQAPPLSDVSLHIWAISDVYIGPPCRHMCHGNGWCDYPNCNCYHGYSGHTCYWMNNPKTYLKDTFNSLEIKNHYWSLTQGGAIGTGCGELVDGKMLFFTGSGLRQVVTSTLDLRNSRFVQYIAMIGGNSSKPGCSLPSGGSRENVILQYSTDGGIQWHTLHVLDAVNYIQPRRDYIHLPNPARTHNTRLRWWQPSSIVQSRVQPFWALDNVLIGGHEINPSLLQENFESPLDGSIWEFSPHGSVEFDVCDGSSQSITWTTGQGIRSLTTGQMIVQDHYMVHFKVVVGCADSASSCNLNQPIRFEYNKSPSNDSWSLVVAECYPSHLDSVRCEPYEYHEGSVYSANMHQDWTRVTVALPPDTFSSITRFRWIQSSTQAEAPNWSIDDLYIGEGCPHLCHGRGRCDQGSCLCDPGYEGEYCHKSASPLLTAMTEGFEGSTISAYWSLVRGGALGYGCGSLLPAAHGKTLYFNGCGQREAVTREMDTSQVGKIMFVIQIGSVHPSSTCNMVLDERSDHKVVLLQYTRDRGINWHLIASHDPRELAHPSRVVYDLPLDAKSRGVQFRWWQPVHDGQGYDQWAIDYVEIVMSRHEQLMRRFHPRGRPDLGR